MSDDNTTPRPWSIVDEGYGPIRVIDANGNRACEISCAMAMTADDVVRAVNAHDDLVKALEEGVLQIEYLHSKFKTTGTGEIVIERARSALAKAKGETK